MRGAVFRQLPHKNKFLKQFYYNKRLYVCCVVTEERLKVPQNLCTIQNYVRNKILTLHFLNCMQ